MSKQMNMIERMADALWNSNKPQGAPDYEELSNVDKFQVEMIARDVLKAMREPTQIMREAGFHTHADTIEPLIKPIDGESDFSRGMAAGRGMISSKETDAAWTAMIDAALKEGED